MEAINISKIECCKCHVLFWVTTIHDDRLIETKETFYCPNGHPQSYQGKTDKQKLAEEKQRSENFKNYYETECNFNTEERKKVKELKKEIAKYKKAVEKKKPVKKVVKDYSKKTKETETSKK